MTHSLSFWLSLDLSSSVGSVALHRGGPGELELVREEIVGHGFQHSERLFACVETMLRTQGLQAADIGRFITTSGPGSFTGLRIAMASWKATAMATGRPMELVSGSEARALAWLEAAEPLHPEICVITHVALDKYVLSRFQVVHRRQVNRVEEKVVQAALFAEPAGATTVFLLDERSQPEKFSGVPESRRIAFPLRARHLGGSLPYAASRRTLEQPAEFIGAVPDYFGSAF